ncbi:MAG: hypothetical protein WCJ49_04870 [Deltaproteobacteria bacterium]
MNQPLTKCYCDVCGKPIEDTKNGYVIWKTTKELKSYDFKIIHQTKCDLKDHPASTALTDFLGEDGLAYLLAKLSIGPIKKQIGQGMHCEAADINEFVDFMRRVQTPFYEEARRHFGKHELLEDYSDSDEVYPYQPEQLEKIAKKYGADR